MGEILNGISVLFIPIMLTVIILHGFVKKANVYDLFVEGCRDGLRTAVDIMPYIIAVFLAITLMTESGALSRLETLCAPVLELAGIPRELVSFMIMRPVSGSGTLVIVQSLAEEYGPDSFLCRCASVMMGSSETLFYAVAVYFGATSVKHMKHTVPVGIAGYVIGIWLSLVLCRCL